MTDTVVRTLPGASPGLFCQVQDWSSHGFPCIALHGLGDASCVWNDFAGKVGSLRTIGIDLPGHGCSSWDLSQRYTSAAMTAEVAAVIAGLDVGRFVLVGHSVGGDIALRLAAASDRVSALILVDSGPELNKAGVDRVLDDVALSPREFASVESYAAWLKERRPLAQPDLIDAYAAYTIREATPGRFVLRSDPAISQRDDYAAMSVVGERYCKPELWDALAGVTCPVLVIRGVGSAVLPAAVARRMTQVAVAGVPLCVVGGAGHAVMQDNADGFRKAVAQFLGDLSLD